MSDSGYTPGEEGDGIPWEVEYALTTATVDRLVEWHVWEGHPASNPSRYEFAHEVVDGFMHSEWLAAHDAEVARQTLRDAAKAALSDWSENRTRGRLWHEWLVRRAAAIRDQIGENK